MVQLIARRSGAGIVRFLVLRGAMTIEEIAKSTRASQRTVRRHLEELVDCDLVDELPNRNSSETSRFVANNRIIAAAASGHLDYVLGR
ncbi:ArsR family transcriptional regulator [Cryobacterium cryoconiti]|uniref:ArsR family transcriptional regulator n=1 Tax=Cryobacterium cryoconiti TaxID=1259239 RepID=A0A4Y8JSA6_9MICO|nr:ArsR family transcriptional regulator [Cryobacterium cryoconiti]